MNTSIILEKYREYLEDLAKKKSNETFTNAGKEHASILMSILLRYTNSEVRIFCEGFKPDLIMTQPYWDALTEFLKRNNNQLLVMVETDKYTSYNPLKLLEETKKLRNNDSIKVRKIRDADKKHLFQELNTEHCNFAIFDDDKFRLEYIPEQYLAIGSFNQPDSCKRLSDLFDSAFTQAQTLI